MEQEKAIAIFDFDGTMIRRDSLLPWLMYAQSRWSFVYHLPYYAVQAAAYLLWGRKDAGRYKARILSTVMRGLSIAEAERLGEGFARQIELWEKPQAIETLIRHKQQGVQTVLLTASVDAVVVHWAKRRGFDKIIATQMEVQQGYYTGRLYGENCKGMVKVQRLDAELPEWRSAMTYGYGDSPSDLPFLSLCTYSHYGTFK